MTASGYGLRETARALGVALSTLQLARDTGRLTVNGRGRVPDLDAARQQLKASSEVTHPESFAARGAVGAEEGESRADALRREAIARADLREFERDLQAGKLVLASEVQGALTNVFSACRDRILALPTRLRGELGEEFGARGWGIATNVCREVLEELAATTLTKPKGKP